MKTKALFLQLFVFSLISQSYLIKAQTFDANGCPYKPSLSTSSLSATTITYTQNLMTLDSIRALTEINKIDTADAYPYVSPDGLRLYFTQGFSSTDNNLYCVSRNNINDLFSNKQLVSSNFPDGSFSCWLTNDELEIFYCDHNTLYYSTRSSITNPFSVPVIVNLFGNNHVFISGPSLTPDKQELYLFNVDPTETFQVLKFAKSGTLSYTLNDTLVIPSGYIPGPGQLSKDGLKYFLSLANPITTISKLYQYNRSTTTSTFDTLSLTILDKKINIDVLNCQPTVSNNENIIIWVRNSSGIWSGNDLYAAYGLNSSINETIHANSLKIYPNPANSMITIDCAILQNTNILIFNIVGKLMIQRELSSGRYEIDVSSLPKGIYIIQIIGDDWTAQQKLTKE